MPGPSEISPKQLLRLIGTPDCPVIVDVRLDADFDEDPQFVPGAIRHRFDDPDGLMARFAGRPCVILCQKGLKLSQGLAAWLSSEGVRAQYLSGGTHGWRETDGAPRIPAAAIPAPVGGGTLWVTRHRPKIDRIACPWLIRRFVDRDARFLFVTPSQVASVAERFGATPFDVESEVWSHRGSGCTFDTMLDEWALRTDALDLLSTVIRAADTNRHDLAPEAAGLLALSVGLSRQYKDDHAQLAAGFPLYDALYRWARDGQGETHDWPGKAA